MRRVRLRDDVIASRRTRLTPIGDTMKKIALAAALLALTGAASAQLNNKAYIGGAFGPSHINVDCDNILLNNCSNNDTGYKVVGGYKINPVFAIEAGYIDFGKATFTGGSLAVDGFLINAAARAPVTRELNVVGRLGLAMVDAESKLPLSSRSDSATSLYVGLGMEYAFTKNLKGTLAADFTTAESRGDEGAVRLISIGAQYDF